MMKELKTLTETFKVSTGILFSSVKRFLSYLRVLIHYLFITDVSWTLQFTSSGRRAAWYRIRLLLTLLTENIGLTSHVKVSMKKTFRRRKEIIDMSDTISTVVSNFPFLLKAEMVNFLFFSLIY